MINTKLEKVILRVMVALYIAILIFGMFSIEYAIADIFHMTFKGMEYMEAVAYYIRTYPIAYAFSMAAVLFGYVGIVNGFVELIEECIIRAEAGKEE